jgi:hypothetical protein
MNMDRDMLVAVEEESKTVLFKDSRHASIVARGSCCSCNDRQFKMLIEREKSPIPS